MYLSYEHAGFMGSFGGNSVILASFFSLLGETIAETLLGQIQLQFKKQPSKITVMILFRAPDSYLFLLPQGRVLFETGHVFGTGH